MATFPQLKANWSDLSRSDFAKHLGGQLEKMVLDSQTFPDVSTIRLCAAFNMSGHPIPISSLWSGIDIEDKHGMK
jgi:hypothetical protein